ncbi:universal stress protein [Lysobacter sp. A3-1-A15]|uniref:universal stress protein n=1 Tax=Novilysobacter viscosus TaxID=3098602 RepID=UPI002ED9429B
MFKDLLVPLSGTPADADAIRVGIDIAKTFDAHLSLLEIVALPLPAASPWGMIPDVAMEGLYRRLRDQGEANAEQRRRDMADAGVPVEVRLVESLFTDSAHMAAHCAQYADLSVVAGAVDSTADGARLHDLIAELLAHSGRPVLVVPPRNRSPRPPRNILIAWRPSSGTTRALHDALPLLVQAERVDVVIVDPPPGEQGDGPQAGGDIATHLARHGVKANVVVRESKGRDVSALLLEHAGAMPAHLIVAGGYGRSRLREWAMGGVTRELLFSNPMPVFFSH